MQDLKFKLSRFFFRLNHCIKTLIEPPTAKILSLLWCNGTSQQALNVKYVLRPKFVENAFSRRLLQENPLEGPKSDLYVIQ